MAAAAVVLMVTAACSDGSGFDDVAEEASSPRRSLGGLAVETDGCPGDPAAEVEGDTLRLVSSGPQSGDVAPLGQIAIGWQSYFERVNADGGVSFGDRTFQIEWETRDDAYDVGRTVENITSLVGDGSDVFAAFAVVGTANNLAVRDQLDDLCVPHLFAASGSPAWGNREYPWTVGSTQPSYTLESEVFVRLLRQQKPDAKIGLLVQDDDFGRAYELSMSYATAGTLMEIVGVQRYAPGAVDVSAQVEALRDSGADVFFDGATLLPCPLALQHAEAIGWVRAATWVSGTCLSRLLLAAAGTGANGVYSMANLKDTADPLWADDEEVQRYREVVGERFPDADPDDGLVAFGWTQAAIFVEALRASPEASRQALVESLRTLDLDDVGLLLPGSGVRTGPNDLYLGERLSLVQYSTPDDHFAILGEPYDFESQTAELTPLDLVV